MRGYIDIHHTECYPPTGEARMPCVNLGYILSTI